jgi:ferrochelatase
MPKKSTATKQVKPVALLPQANLFPPNVLPPQQQQIGLVFFNLGGPDSLEAVQPFLYNLFADNDIIQLPIPQWLQNIFAWRVSNKRKKEGQENYHKIGGRSPIEPYSRQQAEGVLALVQPLLAEKGYPSAKCYLAMRYWHPRAVETIEQLKADGVTHAILVPLYPHYSLATIGSSLREWTQVLEQPEHYAYAKGLQQSTLCSHYEHPLFLQAVAETIHTALAEKPWNCPPEDVLLVFSAHGLPVDYVHNNKDPYPRQIKATIDALIAQHFPKNQWQLCWQSRVGKQVWLQPYTEDLIEQLAKEGRDNVLMIPIAFVSDHIETLFEMDMLYVPIGKQYGLRHYHRAAALNNSVTYQQCLAQLVLRAVEQPNICKIDFNKPIPLGGVCSSTARV